MQSMLDSINEWLRELLTEGIILNLSGMFDQVNQKVGEIAVDIGTTPAGWHSGIFSIIRSLSETVILPIAGVILAFVMTYELIQIVIDRNNLHEIDTWIFFKWIFKTFIAVMLVTNTFNVVYLHIRSLLRQIILKAQKLYTFEVQRIISLKIIIVNLVSG